MDYHCTEHPIYKLFAHNNNIILHGALPCVVVVFASCVSPLFFVSHCYFQYYEHYSHVPL
jgi:hypothetical protein